MPLKVNAATQCKVNINNRFYLVSSCKPAAARTSADQADHGLIRKFDLSSFWHRKMTLCEYPSLPLDTSNKPFKEEPDQPLTGPDRHGRPRESRALNLDAVRGSVKGTSGTRSRVSSSGKWLWVKTRSVKLHPCYMTSCSVRF